MERLRAPDGCPWDREQTPESLEKYVIEEAYEVCDAIRSGSQESLREELGDLLLQVVFQAQIAREHGHFDINGVVDAISDKMERRHPHVFGDAVAATADDVARQWEAQKRKEKADRGLFDGIPRALPATSKATTVIWRAVSAGHAGPGGVEPLAAARAALDVLGAPGPERDAAIGEALLCLVDLARSLEVDPTTALEAATARYAAAVPAAK